VAPDPPPVGMMIIAHTTTSTTVAMILAVLSAWRDMMTVTAADPA
jgi:hypothetical protein